MPEAAVAAALFADDVPLFARLDGTIQRAAAPLRVHSALLAAAPVPDGAALLTCGEDGRVCRTDGEGAPAELAAVPRKWISLVAGGRGGAIAYAVGRSVWIRWAGGAQDALEHDRNVSAIAFCAAGNRVAVARFGGVAIHPADGALPLELEWKGAFAGLTFSPDDRFLLAFMQDGLLHGWRLSDRKHFRMTGYSARVRDWSWSADGRWLATSGASAAVVWRFEGPDGPMGSAALKVGAAREGALVTAVACHPRRGELAIGYSDGAVLVASIQDEEERLLRAGGDGAVTSVAWHNGGARIAFGTAQGACGVLEGPATTGERDGQDGGEGVSRARAAGAGG
ncbi:MAG TPA: WD40 repeat domain-containing protein [Burkholderiales bacterium]|nr:WD40 repeat domain-containing protein [Burkholderiales bacterium]